VIFSQVVPGRFWTTVGSTVVVRIEVRGPDSESGCFDQPIVSRRCPAQR